ncbi:hypothetical protein [Streptomyces sp. NPDC059874]|uniref:hypothetical protein n=1 Tax=Streptomyces sp. NPDC059874 TaxID=3346983 RepID=UPI0036560C5C
METLTRPSRPKRTHCAASVIISVPTSSCEGCGSAMYCMDAVVEPLTYEVSKEQSVMTGRGITVHLAPRWK